MDANTLRNEIKSRFPKNEFTVRTGSSAGANYITVTLRKPHKPVYENDGACSHSLSIYGFDDDVTSGRYNNGRRLTTYGWKLLSEVAGLIRPLAGSNTFVTLCVEIKEG